MLSYPWHAQMVLSSLVLALDVDKLPLEDRNSPYFLSSLLRTQLLLGLSAYLGGMDVLTSVSYVSPTSGFIGFP